MKIIDVKKELGNFNLDIRNLELESGCIHGFIGGNGSGKTTVAKLIAGILSPDSGEIQYEGLRSTEITMTTQKPYILHSSVYDNLIYPLRIRKIKPDETEIDKILKKYNMLDKKSQYARTLSSGEQQKLSFLRMMVFKPKLVIVDETLSNLDSESLELFENRILEIQQEENMTWIIISHQLPQILKLCDKVHFFSKGRIVESGNKDAVIFHSQHPAVKDYVKSQSLEIKR
jgi:ABC-type multidrug transport system ATPase subunit